MDSFEWFAPTLVSKHIQVSGDSNSFRHNSLWYNSWYNIMIYIAEIIQQVVLTNSRRIIYVSSRCSKEGGRGIWWVTGRHIWRHHWCMVYATRDGTEPNDDDPTCSSSNRSNSNWFQAEPLVRAELSLEHCPAMFQWDWILFRRHRKYDRRQ